tara:strand:- start:7304 stop:8161 length:858 start_codon:yes stop_codon:yes gene_type:complete
MPVYNGAQFLDKSIQSILSQTFSNFELVCVDDSSTDNSYSIIKKYAQIDKRIIALRKPNGGSVPKSWNYVLPFLTGNFITYMSQDDWMSVDNLEMNYIRHLETGANIVVPDLVAYYNEGKNKTFKGVKGDRSLIISGKEAFILSLNWKTHGFNLCEANIMRSELFDENSFNSDEYVTRKNFLNSSKVAFSSGKFYYNRDNPNAITQNFKLHTLTSLLTDQRLLLLMKNESIKKRIIIKYAIKSFARMIYLIYRWKKKKYQDNEMNKFAAGLIKKHFIYLIKMSYW